MVDREEVLDQALRVFKLTPEAERYLTDPVRREEWQAVLPVIESFLEYEMNPPRGKPVGRYAPGRPTPPLGTVLGRYLRSDATREAAESALLHAVATGWLGFASGEYDGNARSRVAFDPSKLWDAWVVELVGVQKQLEKVLPETYDLIIDAAYASYLRELRKANLVPRLRKRMRLKLTGMLYGRAGIILRIIQASPDEDILQPGPMQAINHWPYREGN